MASRSERVLVTGARGFTGRYLCERLREGGYEVIGLVEAGPVATGEIQADLRDAAAIADAIARARPHRVVHLAAVSSVTHGDAEGIYRTNLLGSLALLQALATQPRGARCVILASSANVYGNAAADAIEESVRPVPVNHYAASKLAMEHLAGIFRDRLPLVITRPFNYTGPGQSEQFVVPKIVAHFRNRTSSIELGNIDVVREFMDVRTVVEIYCRLLECEAAIGETINICSGRGVSLREIIGLLEIETGHHMEIRVNPQLVRSSEVHRLLGSPQKLTSLIGPVAGIPLAATLRDMLQG